MDVLSEDTEPNSFENGSDAETSTYLHSPLFGMSEPEDLAEDTMSSDSEFLNEEEMYVAFYEEESVDSGLESVREPPSDSEEIVCTPFPASAYGPHIIYLK